MGLRPCGTCAVKHCLICDSQFDSAGWACPLCGTAPERLEGRWAFAPLLAAENTGFGADYFQRLATLEAGNFWFESRNQLILWTLERFFPQAGTLLEVGCGTGFVLSAIRRRFPHLRLAGGEIFQAGAACASDRLPDVEIFQMDARRIPFRGEFDVLGAFDVLEHIDEDLAALGEFRAALKPGGGLIITVPQHPFLWSAVDEFSFHKRRYTRAELGQKIKKAGFTAIRTTSFVSVLLPLLLLSRLRQKRYTEAFDPAAEYRISAFTNRILASVLGAERQLITAGASLPLGGSLLLVARRAD